METSQISPMAYVHPDAIRKSKIYQQFANNSLNGRNELSQEEENGINIYIGSENQFDEDVTVIKTKYTINKEIDKRL